MENQFREVVRQKILDGLASPLPALTRRDMRMPRIRNKAVAVIGMRRSGKTCFLWQELARRHAGGVARDGLLYFSFEDERLAGMTARELNPGAARRSAMCARQVAPRSISWSVIPPAAKN